MIKVKICNNCGAPCSDNDIYCKSCGQSLSENYDDTAPAIEGIDNHTLKEYVGKNSDYYLSKFAKAKDKKVFIQFNPCALLFGPAWFFYRKMTKIALLYLATVITLSCLLTAIVPIVFAKDVEDFRAAEAELHRYEKEGGDIFAYNESGAIIGSNEAYKALKNDVKDAHNKIKLINLLINAPAFILNIGFRFFANAVYKYHVTKHIDDNDGGTTSKFKAFLLANLLPHIITGVIGALLLLIPAVYNFQSALNATSLFY